jgi:hypothetical protein
VTYRSDLTPTERDLLGVIFCDVPAWAGLMDDGWVAEQARLFIRSMSERSLISDRLMSMSREGYGRALRGLARKGVMVQKGRGRYALAEFYWPDRWRRARDEGPTASGGET